MATEAWNEVTPETIRSCWKHAGIQHDPITVRLPAPTLVQQGWSIILKFASGSDMTLPKAEAELQVLFKDHYNDSDWRPALKLVTECKPDDNVIEAISKLRESMSAMTPTPPSISEESSTHLLEYNEALEDLGHSIGTLKKRNRLFKDVLTANEFVELEGEDEEEEEVKLRTDEEIVEEVTRELAGPEGETVDEVEEDNDSDDEEPLSLAEMMDAAMKLENGAPMVGGCGTELSALCRRFRIELRRAMDQEARQTTLDRFFVRDQ